MAQTDVTLANSALLKLGANTITSLSETTGHAPTLNARLEFCRKTLLRMHPWNFVKRRSTLSATVISGVAINGGLVEVTTSTAHGLVTGDIVTIVEVIGPSEVNGKWTVTNIDTTHVRLQGSAATLSQAYVSGGYIGKRADFDWAFLHTLPADFLRLLGVGEETGASIQEWEMTDGKLGSDGPTVQIRYIRDIPLPSGYADLDPMFFEALACYLAYDVAIRVTQSQELKQQMLEEFTMALSKARFADASENPLDLIQANDFVDARFGANFGFVRDPRTN